MAVSPVPRAVDGLQSAEPMLERLEPGKPSESRLGKETIFLSPIESNLSGFWQRFGWLNGAESAC
jgi:hypothetical protein